MVFAKRLSLFFVACSFLGAQQLAEDPVMKARTQRALAQGISEADLPPVPRSIMEPPPLPPPETHLKDSRGAHVPKAERTRGRAARAAKGGRPARKASKAVTKGAAKGVARAAAKPTPSAAPKARHRRGKA